MVKAETYLGLLLLQKPLALLEQFSITLQSEDVDFDSVEQSVKTVQKLVLEYRDSEFEKHFAAATALPDSALDNITIKPLKLPRQRTVPARYGGGNCQPSSDIEQHYRIQYFSFVDRITREVTERFSTESDESDLDIYKSLADIIKTGKVMDKELVRRYPELDLFLLSSQVTTFKDRTKASSVYEAKKSYQDMSDLEKKTYPQVLVLLKLLLVCPISSSVCERSFSTLRRLKTWLRNTVGQERLNNNMICNIHSNMLMKIDLNVILNEFVNRSVIRRNRFGVNKFE